MEKPVFFIEMPPLDDETAANMHEFLTAFVQAFEGHYYCQIQRYYHRPHCEPAFNELAEGEDPF